MKEIIPGLGDRKARDRLDELFSRQTLGAVLFGSAASKVVEKFNMILVIVAIIYLFNIDVTADMWVVASLLLISWSVEFIAFVYLYVKWEKAMEIVDDTKDKAKDKASETKDKAKDKASETAENVKEKAKDVKDGESNDDSSEQ